ncbi:hypothetical protein BKH46_06860 [Helicobacter sp. 12S02634-8]|uniref:winged helix-turn-helix domain-containing protein n=1 Tax=Helicobacter sp. 12S02634-8 TaxID=1476199 RepID=UPI000BA6E4A3|nr:LysR family transcriptional regulator [Helicobacter sp. 12S02634-8]PAF46683.1 hypothetical protein BKH46_06860 [Helicobacter sp. 12S02634-8]
MRVFIRFWITKENKNFLGKGKVELLEHIKATGSISKAAKNMQMSYKAAWDSIDMMNHLSVGAMVESVSGGKGGGGTKLTAQGERAIVVFKKLERVIAQIEGAMCASEDFDSLEQKIILLEKQLTNLS